MKTPAERMARVIRKSLTRQVAAHADRRVGVALSGGVDSCSVLAAMLGQGIRPVVVSYTPSTHESTDYRMARDCAASFGLEFVPAVVDMNGENLDNSVRWVIKHGYYGKVEVECLVPLVTIHEEAHAAGIEVLFTGDQADGYFANSKWAAHNMDRADGIPRGERTNVQQDANPARIDRLRRRYYELDKSCSEGVKALGQTAGVYTVVPYRDPAILEASLGLLWKEVNRPRVKEPIRLAFELLDNGTIPTRKLPVNLHKGDSEFAATLGREMLLRYPGARSARGLYAAMKRGEV